MFNHFVFYMFSREAEICCYYFYYYYYYYYCFIQHYKNCQMYSVTDKVHNKLFYYHPEVCCVCVDSVTSPGGALFIQAEE